MNTINYPRRDVAVEEVLSQRTFDLATASLMSWRQGAGAYGALQLHACWSDSSTLGRRYHGQTISDCHSLIKGFIALYERTEVLRWRLAADDIVANILHLQTPEGGFYHASAEFEPTYTAEQSCPIHQGLPLLALLTYAGWRHADPIRSTAVWEAIDRHLRWFTRYWWKRGNRWSGPLESPGFCGVTNQDLVIVAVLARYASVFNNESLYRTYGEPVLEMYLHPRYYHEAIGLFERGDKPNFAERTPYYDVIVPMLQIIHEERPDPHLPAVIDNVVAHLFDAVCEGDDGMTHLAWGAETDPADKTAVTGWIRTPHTFGSYPGLLWIMHEYLLRHPDAGRQKQYDALERTLAAYVFADGTIPVSLGGDDPTFAAISRERQLWRYLIKRLGKRLADPQIVPVPSIRRTCGPITYRSCDTAWSLERDGIRRFAGFKRAPGAIAIGPDESIVAADLSCLDAPDYIEQVG